MGVVIAGHGPAITTSYRGATNAHDARIVVTSPSGRRMVVRWDGDLGQSENHDAAAIAAVAKWYDDPCWSSHALVRGCGRSESGWTYVLAPVTSRGQP
jgi:predicted molibdopterin-dependent oxidoreductase YjgC